MHLIQVKLFSVSFSFKKEYITPPDYFYIKKNKRFHKFNFRKKKLLKKYPNILNENMTETEMVKELGYDKIWNCGLIKYIFEK